MRYSIYSTNRKSAIKHTSQECDSISPTSDVLKVPPYKGTARMSIWHSSQHDDCDQSTTDDQHHSHILHYRYQSIREDTCQRDKDRDEDIGDVNVPGLNNEVRVEYGIELDSDVGTDLHNRSQIEEPAEEIDASSEETEYSAVL